MQRQDASQEEQRGSRTYGYGRVSQHRGIGQRGGHGKTGRRKHKWSYILRYEPDYFAKRGFKPPQGRDVDSINVGELDEQVRRLLKEKKAVRKRGAIYIDLDRLGYNKLLGRGQATHPLIIKVASHSDSAAEKITRAKGRILQAQTEKVS
ncbi:MAG: uL15 family ribosomal protein [Candidatus Bathyarchaeia archaeon]